MKLNKTFIVTISFLLFAFLVCEIFSFTLYQQPELIKSTITPYKFLCGLKFFLEIMPAFFATGYLIGWSFDFGEKPEGSLLRFSPAMFTRFKTVIICSLICVFFTTAASEFFSPILNQKIQTYKNLVTLKKEYKNFSQRLYEQGRFELAYQFAVIASKIDPTDKDTLKLIDKTESKSKQKASTTSQQTEKIDMKKILPNEIDEEVGLKVNYGLNKKIIHTDFSEPFTIYSLLQIARACIDKEDWFGAHYYSQIAIRATNGINTNLTELKQIAATSWNKISEAREEGTNEEKRIFAKKFEGYNALMENNDLKAYYIFKSLYSISKANSLDPDIRRYLQIAENRLEKQYFFSDETFNLQAFESSQNVYFKLDGKNNTTNIFFIKGVTTTGSKNDLVQYLRGFSMFTVDSDGNYLSGIYTPYAKMTSVPTKYFDEATKLKLRITPEIKSVPYIMLESVDRNVEKTPQKATILQAKTKTEPLNHLILPIEFTDFGLIKLASSNINSMDLHSIFNFLEKAERYGFAKEIYWHTLLNRLLYPLFILICLISIGIVAWHERFPKDLLFKFVWILVYPFLCIISELIYLSSLTIFRLINYSLFSSFGKLSLIIAPGLYVLIIFIVSIGFLGCHNSNE